MEHAKKLRSIEGPAGFQAPVIQVAGVGSLDEALMIAGFGATHLGFPLRLAVHREDLGEAEAARIARALPRGVTPVVITYEARAEEIVRLCARLGAPVVQVHGDPPLAEIARLRALAPDLGLVKSLVVGLGGPEELEAKALALAPFVDAFITDTYDPETGATGATGKVHDWSVSRRLVEVCPRPLILAGGLNPDNVARAVARVRPAGVDAHTGLEGPDGFKAPGLVLRFVTAARAAFARLGLG
ncbi:MAG: phosphoribosylanthranilate isomerase [Desulfovibrionaceae bacterium]|nr:phosphoribosylanthranilate isomerase [Desulfovibrionaceae bacterium]